MAKRDVSAIVSGAGLLTSIFTELVDAVRERGGTDEDIHRLATPQGKELIGKIADVIVGKSQSVGEVYPVTINYDLSLKGMVRVGGYDWVNDNIIDKNFPVTGEGQGVVTLELVHCNRPMTSDEALAELAQRGMRPATLPELLAFGAKYPNVQREFPVAALGSVWRLRFGGRCVPFLWGRSGKRNLNLNWLDHRWNTRDRFLAVRNSLHFSRTMCGFFIA